MKLSFNMAFITLIFTAMLLASGCQTFSADERQPNVTPTVSSRVWAVGIEKPGLPNLRRVSDDLYCGAQPTAEGFLSLKAMGVKTVINLRSFHDDREKIAGTDLAYEEIPMHVWRAEHEDVIRFLKIVAEKSRAPFFVHCQHGSDRTGMICAAYRIAIQGWTKDEAIAEMTLGGFGYHWFWKGLVDYIRKLDVANLKRQAFPSCSQEIAVFGSAQSQWNHSLQFLPEFRGIRPAPHRLFGTQGKK